MSIDSEYDLERLRTAGKIVRLGLDAMAATAIPGVTTAELDAVCAKVLAEHGANSAPRQVYRFPGNACISVNDEAIHGVPGSRKLKNGDLLKLDVTVEKDGYFADAAITVSVGEVSAAADALARCAETAFRQAMHVARAGYRLCEIGRAVEREVRRNGFSVMREFCGHGIGHTIHEEPSVPNYLDLSNRRRLHEGLVLAIEPIIAAGEGRAMLDRDGWTVRTADRSLAAHYEHTVVITKGDPVLLTA